ALRDHRQRKAGCRPTGSVSGGRSAGSTLEALPGQKLGELAAGGRTGGLLKGPTPMTKFAVQIALQSRELSGVDLAARLVGVDAVDSGAVPAQDLGLDRVGQRRVAVRCLEFVRDRQRTERFDLGLGG